VERLEVALASLALSVLSLGLALVLLLPPPFTRVMSATYSEPTGAGTSELAEAARHLVVAGDPGARAILAGVMSPEAISHLDDVRAVIAAAILVTAMLMLGLAVWIGVAVYHRRYAVLGGALSIGAAVVAGLVVSVALFAAVDFDAFFSGFHRLFFEPGTWVFPSDSVLIRLFPEPFWVAAGVAWAVLILAVAALYAALAWALRVLASEQGEIVGAIDRTQNA
jgi:integral membrane protein (TIGR01906 family)